MKLFPLPVLLVVGLVSSTSAWAGFKIPSHVYTTKQLPEAAELAEKENKTLAFVYTDETST